METKDQKQVWDNIAPEWHKFRQKPFEKTMEFLKSQKGKILDLGSGSGRHLTNIKNGKMYLVDFSKEMISFAKKKSESQDISAEFFVIESTNLPFEDNYFDAAIFISVLMCIEKAKNREKAIKELYRVLKPRSKAFINVWNKDSEWFKNSSKDRYMKWRDKGIRYYYLYEEKEVHDLFESLGFKIIEKFKPDKSINFIVEKPTSSSP
ncbi:class I SAM-dependent methyltransferase [Candidatus Pacearchaeota archaeon]|nr:class I SAM-dependent methyltransferase [Candidatus Pacearchaeota archaeon]